MLFQPFDAAFHLCITAKLLTFAFSYADLSVWDMYVTG